MPNEPPTLPVSTCTLSGVVFSTPARPAFMPITPWLHGVQREALRSPRRSSPIAARGSIALTTRRLLTSLSLTLCAAAAKAAATLSAVAVVEVEADVARHVVVERRRAGRGGLLRRGHDRQRLDVDLDRLGGVLGLQQRLGDHAGDRIADEAHLVGRQRRPRRLLQVGAVPALERQRRLQRAVVPSGRRRCRRRARPASPWRPRCRST